MFPSHFHQLEEDYSSHVVCIREDKILKSISFSTYWLRFDEVIWLVGLFHSDIDKTHKGFNVLWLIRHAHFHLFLLHKCLAKRGWLNLQGSFTSTGLVVSSKLPRFSDEYTLTIDSADPKSISAGKSVQFTKSVTQWSLSLSFSLSFSALLSVHYKLELMLYVFCLYFSGSRKREFLSRVCSGKTWKH